MTVPSGFSAYRRGEPAVPHCNAGTGRRHTTKPEEAVIPSPLRGEGWGEGDTPRESRNEAKHAVGKASEAKHAARKTRRHAPYFAFPWFATAAIFAAIASASPR